MRFLFAIVLLLPLMAQAANIRQNNMISCISDESSLQGRTKEFVARSKSEKAKSLFSEWMFAENFGDMKSKIKFEWQPRTDKGPSIKLETTDKSHNLIKLRSYTKNSLIVVSSASSPFSTESWTFVLNFQVETVIATRVQSNIGGLKGEVITYNCNFESLSPNTGANSDSIS